MSNIRILDCTLRDGGRIIDCAFPDEHISSLVRRLSMANIDIIEIGFLRDANKIQYKGNSTFFTAVEQIAPFLPKTMNEKKAEFVAFIDYGLFNFESLSAYDGTSVDGIRFGFTHKNFVENRDDIIRNANQIKQLGYKLYIQGVNTPSYSSDELKDVIDMVNLIQPYSFGIVDTYGSMDLDDLRRVFDLVNDALNKDICIDFHSHNNFQLSYALSQEIINLADENRSIIIDSTLFGMGKSAGNLNTELIAYYLYSKKNKSYNLDDIYDMIDDYVMPLRETNEWGFSLPCMVSGIYQSHPNNVLFLTDQYRISAKDVKYIISKIDPELRQRYDYDNIKRIYTEYNSTKIDDREVRYQIRSQLVGKCVLLIMPGYSLDIYADKINKFVIENNPIIISTSFVYHGIKSSDYVFYANPKRYEYDQEKHADNCSCKILTSNIKEPTGRALLVNYESLIENQYKTFENSSTMLIRLPLDCGIEKFTIAGFDGFNGDNDYFSGWTPLGKTRNHMQVNKDICSILKNYALRMTDNSTISFLTPSRFEKFFGGNNK